MTDEEIKQMCIVDLIDSCNYIQEEIEENPCKKFSDRHNLEDLYWTLHVYEELYFRMLNSEENYEEIIAEFQNELLRERNNSYMRMYMLNISSEFLEYIYTMAESDAMESAFCNERLAYLVDEISRERRYKEVENGRE